MIFTVLIFLLSFIASFIFAGYETGLVSINRLKVEHSFSEGDKRSKGLLSLLDRQAQVISTVLIGNNIALVGMQSSFTIIVLTLISGAPDFVVSLLLTALALIFCELLPKSLFRIYSYKMTYFFTPLIGFLNTLFSPITFIISLLSRGRSNESESMRQDIVKAELVSVATEGGRNKELNEMVPTMAEAVFKNEDVVILEYCKDLVVLNCSDSELNKVYKCATSTTLQDILQDDILFNYYSLVFDTDEGRVEIPTNKILDKILFSK